MGTHKRNCIAMFFSALTLAGCDDFPKDVSGTTESVLASDMMRAGIVAGGDHARERALAMRIAGRLGVEAAFHEGTTETLVQLLDAGEFDIVIGAFAKASPWSDRVALTAPVRAIDAPPDRPVIRAMVRPGENRWLIFVTRVVKGETT